MSELPEAGTFDYDGYLIFRPILTELRRGVDSSGKDLSELLEKLPVYTPGTPSEPGEGFERIPLSQYLDGEEINLQNGDALAALRYTTEEFQQTEAVVGGERRNVAIPTETSVEIYWKYPDYMLFRGSERAVQTAKSTIRSVLFESLSLKDLQFDSDFLLWLAYKSTSDHSDPLGLRRITDVELHGEQDWFGQHNSVSGSIDISKSIPVLIGLLQNKSIVSLEGDFTVSQANLRARISEERVHIKASKGGLATATKNCRIAFALNFLQNLVSTYLHWKNSSPDSKYPPLSFFEELYRECKNQGVDIQTDISATLREYASKREENLEEYGYES